jgi:hypothetical protein
MCNYRPVSLLSHFSNIVEELICNMLINFIVRNGIVTEIQNGFRGGRKRSTEAAIQSYLESKQEAIKKVKAIWKIILSKNNVIF